jgi:hypothetical protein
VTQRPWDAFLLLVYGSFAVVGAALAALLYALFAWRGDRPPR